MTVDKPDKGIFLFVDIDNTLYTKDKGIDVLMGERINDYFQSKLGLDSEHATKLHQRYYREYGIALDGLLRHHSIDIDEYNRLVDDSLPLDKILHRDQPLREMLQRIDRTKVTKLWLFTNAYKTHGERVVKLIGVDDLFDGLTYCDYYHQPLHCKPKPEAFEKAMEQAGVTDKSKCWFVDDSALNVKAAKSFGWAHNALLHYPGAPDIPAGTPGVVEINHILDLPKVWPDIFLDEPVTSEATTNGVSKEAVNGATTNGNGAAMDTASQ